MAEEYVVLSQEHVSSASSLISQCFSVEGGEPLNVGRGITAEEMLPHASLVVTRTCQQKLSTACLVDGQLAGVMVSEDLLCPLLPESDPAIVDGTLNISKFGPIFELLEGLQSEFFKTLQDTPSTGQIFHQMFLAVDPRFAGKGIAGRLIRENAELARSHGFTLATMEATGRFSQAAAKKNGFTIACVSKRYDDISQGGEMPFSEVEKLTGHTHSELLVRSLIETSQ
eukprot:TRINITY_DN18662_c0_g1_i1.p1 TRINITY_DN18662_c0_g1~~TRINITY_DN18662_c0_g1_i1.p1  ORF type:complete len:241 (-),score=35.21 TRINITY_DN18662_c0_g1_i1:7-687(-)